MKLSSVITTGVIIGSTLLASCGVSEAEKRAQLDAHLKSYENIELNKNNARSIAESTRILLSSSQYNAFYSELTNAEKSMLENIRHKSLMIGRMTDKDITEVKQKYKRLAKTALTLQNAASVRDEISNLMSSTYGKLNLSEAEYYKINEVQERAWAISRAAKKEKKKNEDERLKRTVSPGADFTITNITIKPYEGSRRNADVAGKLWVAHGNIRNSAQETKIPGYQVSVYLIDAKGREFKKADSIIALNSSFYGPKIVRFTDGILPGQTRNNVQIGIFDVSPDAVGLQLCAKNAYRSCTS